MWASLPVLNRMVIFLGMASCQVLSDMLRVLRDFRVDVRDLPDPFGTSRRFTGSERMKSGISYLKPEVSYTSVRRPSGRITPAHSKIVLAILMSLSPASMAALRAFQTSSFPPYDGAISQNCLVSFSISSLVRGSEVVQVCLMRFNGWLKQSCLEARILSSSTAE